MKRLILTIAVIVTVLGFPMLVTADNYDYPWPVDTKYVLNTGYPYGAKPDPNKDYTHTGIDITRTASGESANGTPVYAPISGTANYYYCTKGGKLSSYGNFCIIESGNVQIYLCHMSSLAFNLSCPMGNKKTGIPSGSKNPIPGGQNIEVKVGDLIGYVGEAGNTTGPHLHVEVRINGTIINPTNKFDPTICARDVGTGNGGSSTHSFVNPPSCGCSDQYAGMYTVETNSANLNIRSGHGTNYEPTGSIKKGEKVAVLKGDGKWAHIYYNGKTGYAAMQYLKKYSDTVILTLPATAGCFASNNVYTTNNSGSTVVAPVQEETPTVATPDSIVHIDNPSGAYDGSNHVEISGWIASRYDLTYVMGECEAFGQINLSGNLTDASSELNNAGYGDYSTKVRFRSVIDRKYLRPNTEYSMKVWAGLSNGATSGVCSQRFNVTSIEPVVINITNPSSSSFTAGKDVTISGNIFSLNPITDATARLADINGSSQVVNFDLNLNTVSGSGTYPYGYTFSGTLPLSKVLANNTTASVFVTAIDENNIQKTKARTFTIGKVVVGDLGNYQFNFNQESVRIYASGVQTLSGSVYANGPIADVMAAIAHWTGGKQVQLVANVQEITPPAGYQYAKSFSLNVSAGDLCNILDVDSFVDGEFRAVFWADLVSDSGQGVHSQTGTEQKIYGSNVTRPTYTVTYNANGGSGAPGTGSFKHGLGHTISTTIPTRTGYSFRGWTTSSSSNQVKYVPGSSYNSNSSITLYAVWEKAVNIPTDLLSYNFNASVSIKNAPKVYKLVPSETTMYRFTASGSAGADVVIQNATGGTVTSFSNGSKTTKEVILNANQLYYIVVKPFPANTTGSVVVNILRSYKISFNAAGGTNAPSGSYYQFAGEGLTLPVSIPNHDPVTITYVYDEFGTQTQKNYNVAFNGWANFDFGTYEIWEPGDVLDNNRSMTLTALWDYQMVEEPKSPDKEGWVISAWKDSEGREVDLEDCIALEDTTYYAVWIPSIPLEGISVTPEKMNLSQGEQVRLTVTQIPEDAFAPEVIWESSNPGVATVSADGQVTALSEGVSIITATVVENPEYTSSAVIVIGSGKFVVDFDASGGKDAPDSFTVEFGDSFSIPDDVPIRTGYTFLGWSFDGEAGKEIFHTGDYVTIDRDCTLYAIWTPNEFTVSYNANGGEDAPDAQIKVYDEELVLSTMIPVRDGFSFAGWADDPSALKAEYAAGGIFDYNRDTVLYAVWLEHAEDLSLNYSTLALCVGQQKVLKAYVKPEGAEGTAVRWKSSDESVVSVKNGLVKAVSSGQADIICTVPGNADITAKCTVRVAPKAMQEGILDTPVALENTVRPGDIIRLPLKFVSENAAYAKILYSYDESALELKSASAEGSYVTLGNKAVVLAVSNGKLPNGTQTELVFHVKDDAEAGSYKVDTAVVECYTINEEETNLFASAADGIRISCNQHTPEMIEPEAATHSANGSSIGWKCSVCGEVLTEQSVIDSGNCYWLPDSLKEIEEEAFEGLPVQQIVLSENMIAIGNRAFKDCEQLMLVVIPETVTEIGEHAFDGCGSVCIMAPSGSYAEQYAQDNNMKFAPVKK